MNSRELKKHILYEMATEYYYKYYQSKLTESLIDKEAIIARAYNDRWVTEAKIKRFEKILQEIVDNFESKLK
jgi:hypothetical protein